jgi:leucyl-tRNA synthetase
MVKNFRRMTEQFLFPTDREKQARVQEKDRRSRIYGTPEFHFAYARYIRSPEWRKLCRLVKERAKNRCERCIPGEYLGGSRLTVHHLTYDRFMNETLTDLQLLCDAHQIDSSDS